MKKPTLKNLVTLSLSEPLKGILMRIFSKFAKIFAFKNLKNVIHIAVYNGE